MTLMHAHADIILFFLWARENFADIAENMTPGNKHIKLVYAILIKIIEYASYGTNYKTIMYSIRCQNLTNTMQ
jgi:hypothetical protein